MSTSSDRRSPVERRSAAAVSAISGRVPIRVGAGQPCRVQGEGQAGQLLHDAVVQVGRYPSTFGVGGVHRVLQQPGDIALLALHPPGQ